jgi:acetyltransferase-like isoleucine patch superfamily enzyme
MIKNFLRKIYRVIFPLPLPRTGISLGGNVGIKSSAILTTLERGRIIFEGQNYIGRNVEIGTDKTIFLGYGSTIQDRSIILGEVEIGKFCLIAPHVFIDSHTHNYSYRPEFYIRDQDEMRKKDEPYGNDSTKITIEDDCWIAMNAMILPGATIGRGSVICGHSVVTGNVPPFSVVAGQPARIIKRRVDFKPKSEIIFSQDADLPNFYKGFFLDVKNLEKDRAEGGVAAENTFTVYVSKGTSIKINIKKLTEEPVVIFYHNQTKTLTQNEFEEITFNSCSGEYHTFETNLPKRYTKRLLIKKIGVF